ncbi:citronellol/citronellal dehydrogenase [Litorimonas taeanensis]|uniref:Citronellol/citronellal dehydrogenase n=1 Tax=Litorimonas taeanensis TaxID=568099 RepID=A0A420WMH0_9PROT|nr:NAD(P)-dependent oxidoreductase [Litorimonas taeanensis]RKQ72112.1 citronellol/citronellal dehydrogenase [Litorimonas taeanensis]
MSLKGKTIFMSGGSRGIGLEIAKKCAADGASIAIAAKTAEPHPKLSGTIYTAAQDIEEAGGQALPLICDIREEDTVAQAVEATVEKFGGIDICINNASAISLTPTLNTPMKRYDLMNQVNARGTFLVSQKCLPHLKKASNPHILNIAPPLDMNAKWFKNHVAYTMAKYGMSLCTLGMSEEFRADGIAVNSLWPMTSIDTAAVRNVLGGDSMAKMSRVPQIMADAAYCVFSKTSSELTGQFIIDEFILAENGVEDFSVYNQPGYEGPLAADFFVPSEMLERSKSNVMQHPGYM